MKKMIACCGVDCATCDAYVATLNNDDALRRTTAERWGAPVRCAGGTGVYKLRRLPADRRPAWGIAIFGVSRYLRYPHLLFGKAARDLRRV